LAFIGGLYSTLLTSVLVYYGSQLFNPIGMVESLVFGSLISSTDPVTVLSMLPSNIDKRLYMLIFGESALNDAVAIILYRFFTELAQNTEAQLGGQALLLAVAESILVFLGSFLVGGGYAFVFALISKHIKMPEDTIYQTSMLFVFAYASYITAELADLTGIISVSIIFFFTRYCRFIHDSVFYILYFFKVWLSEIAIRILLFVFFLTLIS